MNLDELRLEINDVDSKLVPLLLERMELSHQVGVYKKAHGIPILNSTREQEILEKVCDPAPPEQKAYIKKLYEKIMEVSREYQADIMGED